MVGSSIRNSRDTTSTVVRATGLLRYFTPERTILSLPQIQTMSGFSRTTTFRYLSDLVEAGLLTHAAGGYSLAETALSWGRTMDPWHRVRDGVMPTLVSLHRRTGLTVNLAMPTGHTLILVEKITPAPTAVPHTHVGSPLAAHATALGKALLTLMPTDQREEALSESLRNDRVRTAVSPRQLRRELTEIGQRQWAREVDESRTGYWCAAVPIRFNDGNIAAISVAASHDRPLDMAASIGLRRAASSLPPLLC
jgi:DNA-binding IclR family transcriptional regulator